MTREQQRERMLDDDPLDPREEEEHWDGDDECEGHESLDGAHMGVSVYCDGSCRR